MLGIYKITNKVNNKIYIGQTHNIEKRKEYHMNNLINNRHPNQYLQNSYNKWGIENFEFEIVELLDDNISQDELTNRERFWINYYGGINSNNTYNLREAGSNGLLSDEAKLKIKKHNELFWNSEAGEIAKQKIRSKILGRKHSEETRKKLSIKLKGKKRSEEFKRKVSNTLKGRKGRKLTEEEKHALSIKIKSLNYRHSDEIKRKISEANKGRKHTDEAKKKISIKNSGSGNGMFGKHLTEEHKRKLSDRMKGVNNPLYGKHLTKEQILKAVNTRMKNGSYIAWNKGIPMCEGTKQKLHNTSTNRKWINNGEYCLFIKVDKLQNYLDKGFKLGRIYVRNKK